MSDVLSREEIEAFLRGEVITDREVAASHEALRAEAEKVLGLTDAYKGAMDQVSALRARVEALTYENEQLRGRCVDKEERIRELEAENKRLRESIQTVLDDEESQEGGWGPDQTMVGVLREALARPEEEK